MYYIFSINCKYSLNYSENMNKINGMRARLLFEKFYVGKQVTNVEFTFGGMVSEVLKIPSHIDTQCCAKKVYSSATILASHEILNNNLSKLQDVIEANFEESELCTRCRKKPMFKREYGNHLFVRVGQLYSNVVHCQSYFFLIAELVQTEKNIDSVPKFIIIFDHTLEFISFCQNFYLPKTINNLSITLLLFCLLLQIFTPDNLTGKSDADLEPIMHQLKEVPLSISLKGKIYQAAAAILFQPPEEAGACHYTAAVRFNKSWKVYDDLRPVEYGVRDDIQVIIHTILYVISE